MPANRPTNLQATERDTTLNPRQLRKAGFIPATIYGGNGTEPRSIQVRSKEFTTEFAKGNRVYILSGLNPDVTARAHKLQVDPVTQNVLSLEFLELDAAGTQKALEAESRQKEAVKQAEEAKAEALKHPNAEPKAETKPEAQVEAPAVEAAEDTAEEPAEEPALSNA